MSVKNPFYNYNNLESLNKVKTFIDKMNRIESLKRKILIEKTIKQKSIYDMFGVYPYDLIPPTPFEDFTGNTTTNL